MADRQVSVTITGRDALSPVFQKVSASAQQAGRTIDQAGKSVQTMDRNVATAATSMSKFDQAVAKAEQTTSKLNISASKVGAVMGTAVSAGMLLSVRAAAEAEVSQERLRASVEATGALYEQYASQISAASNTALSLSFDDEDALDALSQLTQATGDTQAALDDLGLAMDIARGRGIDLASASKIVAAAEQERFGALQRLGIQIDANATKESVLADLQAKYAGQAQVYAETNAGAFDRWQNAAENAAESVGAFLGPAQQLLLVFPGLAAGATALSAAFATMGLAMGPVGLAAAAVLAAAGLYKLWDSAEGMVSPVQVADKALGNLEETVRSLYATGSTLGELGSRATEGIFPDLERDVARIEEIQNAIATTNQVISMSGAGAPTPEQEADLARWSDELMDLADKYGIMSDASMGATISTLDVAGAMNDLNTVLSYQGKGAAQAQAEVAELFDQYDRGEIGADTLIKDLHTITTSLDDYDKNATKAAASTAALGASSDQLTAKQIALMNAIHGVTEAYNVQHSEGGQNLAGEHREVADALEAERKALAALQAQQIGGQNLAGEHRATMDALRMRTESLTDAINRQKQAVIDAQNAATAAANVRPMGAPSVAPTRSNNPPQDFSDEIAAANKRITESFNAATAAATGTTKALDSGFQVVVGNTNAIAQSSQQVADWADELIGAAGTYATMDDLLARGVITQEDYNAAQAAYTPIAEANRRIQDDILGIQTRQAPVIADLAEQQADYLDSLAGMPAEQQAFALAMMDSATSAQALQLATGLLSENGDVFVPMIEQAANLDPYLATILQQMGLIEQMPDGTWKVTVDTSQADSAFDNISGAVDELNNTVLLLVALLDDDPFTNTADDVKAKMNEIDGSTATPSVFLNDGASGPLGTIAGLLTSLDGRTVTTYVNTVSTFSGSSISPLGYASGGTVSPYGYSRAAANGLTATLVGERGPEVLMLPGGAQVMNTEGSRSRMGGGGGFTFINKGTIIGISDLEDKIFESFSKAWQRANQQHERSMGW